MNKLTRGLLLLVVLVPYIFFGTFELAFGTLSMVFEKCMLPFRWISNKILDKANELNTK
jgi:hypothetical protein